jgi:hypothetical protein
LPAGPRRWIIPATTSRRASEEACPPGKWVRSMPIESSGHSRGNPRLFELVEHAPKTGKSPTVWAWPQLIDYLKVAGQPVPGPWPPHQQPRPDPEEDTLPVAVAEPEDGLHPESSPRGQA